MHHVSMLLSLQKEQKYQKSTNNTQFKLNKILLSTQGRFGWHRRWQRSLGSRYYPHSCRTSSQSFHLLKEASCILNHRRYSHQLTHEQETWLYLVYANEAADSHHESEKYLHASCSLCRSGWNMMHLLQNRSLSNKKHRKFDDILTMTAWLLECSYQDDEKCQLFYVH